MIPQEEPQRWGWQGRQKKPGAVFGIALLCERSKKEKI